MDKNIYDIELTDLTYGRGYVYSLQYHIVWCTKYRKQILRNGVDTELKEMLQQLAAEYQFRIMAMEACRIMCTSFWTAGPSSGSRIWSRS